MKNKDKACQQNSNHLDIFFIEKIEIEIQLKNSIEKLKKFHEIYLIPFPLSLTCVCMHLSKIANYNYCSHLCFHFCSHFILPPIF